MVDFDKMNKELNTESKDSKNEQANIELPETWITATKVEEYATFENGNVEVTFSTNSFVTQDSMYGAQNVFKVVNLEGLEQLFATSSKRCMIALSGHFPIKDKRLNIERLGEGMNTNYKVTHIE